jgi:epoxyqueuosine reductase
MINQLKSILEIKGANLVGFANLSGIISNTDMNAGISIAVALNPKIIQSINNGPTKSYLNEYNRANKLLNNLKNYSTAFLKNLGYKAIGIKATETKYQSPVLIPHKTVATRAGLGWIGKSALLVTNEFGSAVRLTSVLTNAPLPFTTKPINNSRCGKCNYCTEKCPAKAISGKTWDIGSNPKLLNYDACRKQAETYSRKKVKIKSGSFYCTICGICINACPWTKKYTSS